MSSTHSSAMATEERKPATSEAAGAAAPRPQGRLRRILLYGSSRGVTEGLLGARGLLIASILGPEAFGAWTVFRLASRYGGFAELGVLRGLEREVAQERAGPGETGGTGEDAARTTLGFVLGVSWLLALLALLASFLVGDPRLALGMRAFAAAVVAERVWFYGLICLRARGEVRRYAGLEIMHAAAQLLFTGVLALRWGLPGAFAGLVLATGLNAGLVLRHVPRRPMLAWPVLRRVLGIGLPVGVWGIAITAFTTADRWVVVAFGGTTLLGYYGFAVAIAGLASSFGYVIRTVVFPDVYGRAHAASVRLAMREHLHGIILPFAQVYPVLLGALAFGIGPAVGLLVPQYLAAVPAAHLFIFTGATGGLISLAAVGIVAMDHQRHLPMLALGGLVVSATLSILAMSTGLGLAGVAGSALSSQMLLGAVLLWRLARGGEIVRPAWFVARSLLPLAYCATVTTLLTRGLSSTEASTAVLGFAAYLVLLIPLLPLLRRQLRALRATAPVETG